MFETVTMIISVNIIRPYNIIFAHYRELCTLFAVLRPYVQKSQLKTSPACCGVFLADPRGEPLV